MSIGSSSRRAVLVAALSLCACGGARSTPTIDAGAPAGTQAIFDLGANLHDPDHFFDVPYPNDLRVDADGHPDLAGFPNPRHVSMVTGLIGNASQAKGFPVVPVAHFTFTAPLAPRALADLIPADPASPILIIDIGAASPDHGKLIPALADTPAADIYIPNNFLSVGPRTGYVLRPANSYGIVVMKSANDANGQPLVASPTLVALEHHQATTDVEQEADAIYAPLWTALTTAGIRVDDVAAATVFTTGSVVQETSDLGTRIVDAYDITIDGLALDTDPDDQYDEFCYLKGHVTYPQFQVGTPPFDTQGGFSFGPDGLPVKQRDEVAPIILLIPKTPMPQKGYPIMFNIHGSGGFSVAAVRPVDDATNLPGPPIGPAFPITSKGIAIAGSAMPLNPERFPGATEIEYLNANNLAAMRDTFRQGTLEQRLFIEAISSVQVDPALLGTCTGPTLAPGATAFTFDPDLILLTGQSMGGMYANILAATEPRVKAVVPTGAGGYWTNFINTTPLDNGQYPVLIGLLLGTTNLDYMHPVFTLGEAALEPADPIIYMPHVARRPLPGHPVRPIYRPVGIGDSYFATGTYDAVAVVFAHQQAGDIIWPSMQDALTLVGAGGIVPYVVEDEMTSDDGTPYTGVVAQFMGDGTYDPHALYSFNDGVKHQYACFWEPFVKTGHARVPPPTTPWQAPCE